MLSHKSSTVYFWLAASEILGALVSRPIAYQAMKNSPFPANWVGVSTHALQFLVVVFMPETLRVSQAEVNQVEALEGGVVAAEGEPSQPKASTWRNGIQLLRNSFFDTFSSMRMMFSQNTKLAVVLVSTIFTTIGLGLGQDVLPIYMTKRFSYQWREVRSPP